MDCLFCKIANGEIPSETVYENDLIKVFLDINPTTNGHGLIVPKKHFTNFFEVDDETLSHINNVIRKLYPIYKEKLGCEGLTICHNSEYGQEIKHFHVHFVPRYNGDNVDMISNKDIIKDVKEISNLLK